MVAPRAGPKAQLASCLETGRIHSAYLLSGPQDPARELALWFVRSLVCAGREERPCEHCPSCRRSAAREPIPLDGSGRKGPLYRHVGDHPDLYWLERGASDTRVRIGQVRALQGRLHLRSGTDGWRAAVIADAEWLNAEAQNALLRLLEEPPPRTALVLVAASAAGLLPTLRSRCQRVALPTERRRDPRAPDAPEPARALAARLDAIAEQGLPELLDWAEEYRGARATAAEGVSELLQTASAWLWARVHEAVEAGGRDLQRELEAFRTLQGCRKSLAQRNANPQMVAERALFALRESAPR